MSLNEQIKEVEDRLRALTVNAEDDTVSFSAKDIRWLIMGLRVSEFTIARLGQVVREVYAEAIRSGNAVFASKVREFMEAAKKDVFDVSTEDSN